MYVHQLLWNQEFFVSYSLSNSYFLHIPPPFSFSQPKWFFVYELLRPFSLTLQNRLSKWTVSPQHKFKNRLGAVSVPFTVLMKVQRPFIIRAPPEVTLDQGACKEIPLWAAFAEQSYGMLSIDKLEDRLTEWSSSSKAAMQRPLSHFHLSICWNYCLGSPTARRGMYSVTSWRRDTPSTLLRYTIDREYCLLYLSTILNPLTSCTFRILWF